MTYLINLALSEGRAISSRNRIRIESRQPSDGQRVRSQMLHTNVRKHEPLRGPGRCFRSEVDVHR